MRAKYLGNYYLTYANDVYEDVSEPTAILIHDKLDEIEAIYNEDYYVLDNFMLPQNKDNLFHGYMSETNTSSIVIKLTPCGDRAKLWRVY